MKIESSLRRTLARAGSPMPTLPLIRYAFGVRQTPAERKAFAKKWADKNRPSAALRGYDRRWKRFRLDYLAANPMCSQHCGRVATEVDHVISIEERPDLRLNINNVRSMCKPCHSARTAKTQAFHRNRKGGESQS
jgi:5-methylcytosine-specific restriction enzyme A